MSAVAQADGDPGELEPDYNADRAGLLDTVAALHQLHEEVMLAISPRAGRLMRARRLLDTRHQEQGR